MAQPLARDDIGTWRDQDGRVGQVLGALAEHEQALHAAAAIATIAT